MSKQADEALLSILQPGDTVFTILRHLSQKGQESVVDAIVWKDGQPVHISHWISRLLRWPLDDRHDGIRVKKPKRGPKKHDMGAYLVYKLSYALYKKTHPKHLAGYVLTQRWL